MKRYSKHGKFVGLALLLTRLAMPCESGAQARPGTGGGTSSFGGRGGTGAGGSSSRTYPGAGQIGEAMIMADPETRRLIIITDEETNFHISQVVTNLDVPKPQVLIKVVFVEVSHTDGFDLGATITRASGKVSNGSASGILSTDSALSAAAALITGVPAPGTLNMVTGDLDATLRAISSVAKTEVLSRPSILTRNNQEAVIIVGREVPYISNSRVDGVSGALVNTVTYRDVGIVLRVTPFITQDGLVEMIVAPEISALDGKTTVSAGVDLDVIRKRSAETVVVTRHAETIVIGGLMETRTEEIKRKVPVLGDIPLIGWAFKRTSTQDVKTELLIFLTPYVIQKPSEVAALTQDETGKSELTKKPYSQNDKEKYFENIPVTTIEAAPDKKKNSRFPIVVPLK